MQFRALEAFLRLRGDRERLSAPPQEEAQTSDYEAGLVVLGSETWRIRTARVTPKKPGAFVAVWERDANGETRPFAPDDAVAGLLVFVCEGPRFGVFRFTTPQLIKLGVYRSDASEGKRGFRVYPSWSTGLNSQATKTQQRQAAVFQELGNWSRE